MARKSSCARPEFAGRDLWSHRGLLDHFDPRHETRLAIGDHFLPSLHAAAENALLTDGTEHADDARFHAGVAFHHKDLGAALPGGDCRARDDEHPALCVEAQDYV